VGDAVAEDEKRSMRGRGGQVSTDRISDYEVVVEDSILSTMRC
jgi:hypothetical protein